MLYILVVKVAFIDNRLHARFRRYPNPSSPISPCCCGATFLYLYNIALTIHAWFSQKAFLR